MFNETVIARLQEAIDPSRVKRMSASWGTFDYLETHDVIRQLNDVFGFDGWNFTIEKLEVNFEKGFVFAVGVLMVRNGDETVIREDVGFGAAAGSSASAWETALKGAVSDALKRAARTFGNQFGLSLYQNARNGAAHGENKSENAEQKWLCEDCGDEVKGFKSGNRYISADRLASARKEKYGRVLCSNCVKAQG